MDSLELRNIKKSFGDLVVLDDVSLSIEPGELFFLLGPSGCGKTTLLRIIAGFCKPDAGSVTFQGRDLSNVPVEKRNIGMVFQNYSLWPHMTVFENVAYGMKMRKTSREDIERRVLSALEMVDMKDLGGRKPAALSGGQQQRIALARALVYEPALLLLDEPLSNLDAKLRKDMRAEIRRIHERLGVTMVYVTHDQEEAAVLAHRIALFHGGRTVQVASPREIYRCPATLYAAQFFGSANALRGTVTSVSGGSITVNIGAAEIAVSGQRPLPSCVPGSKVTVVVRPEHMFFAAETSGPNRLTGALTGYEFNGSFETYSLDVCGTAVVLTRPFDAAKPPAGRPGDTATIAFDAAAAHIISDQGDA